MGHWSPAGAEAFRLRAALGRRDLLLLANVNAEFSTSLDARPLAERARSAAFSSDPDVLCVSGPMTGQGVEMAPLAAVCAAVDKPVFANTGVTIDTVEAILAVADGCVVGTHFKRDGHTWNPVDPDRVARFMRRVADCRRERPQDA
jgi:predicted TIM-barrel enzyme